MEVHRYSMEVWEAKPDEGEEEEEEESLRTATEETCGRCSS